MEISTLFFFLFFKGFYGLKGLGVVLAARGGRLPPAGGGGHLPPAGGGGALAS